MVCITPIWYPYWISRNKVITPLKRLKCSPHQRWRDRSRTMIENLMQVFTGTRWLGLDESQHLQGEEEIEGSVGRGTIGSRTLSCRRCPFLPHEEPVDQTFIGPPLKSTFSHHSDRAKQARCTTITLDDQTLEGSETEEAPPSANFPSLAQHQVG